MQSETVMVAPKVMQQHKMETMLSSIFRIKPSNEKQKNSANLIKHHFFHTLIKKLIHKLSQYCIRVDEAKIYVMKAFISYQINEWKIEILAFNYNIIFSLKSVTFVKQ
jgi:hypothetical protein